MTTSDQWRIQKMSVRDEGIWAEPLVQGLLAKAEDFLYLTIRQLCLQFCVETFWM